MPFGLNGKSKREEFDDFFRIRVAVNPAVGGIWPVTPKA
jgi:hypothetical protein